MASDEYSEETTDESLPDLPLSGSADELLTQAEEILLQSQKTEYEDWQNIRRDLAQRVWHAPPSTSDNVSCDFALLVTSEHSARETEKTMACIGTLPNSRLTLIIDAQDTRFPNAVTHATWMSALTRAPNPDRRWVCYLRPGDLVEASVFPRLLQTLSGPLPPDLLYADEDGKSPSGQPFAQIKPDADPDLLRSAPYMGRFLMMRLQAFLALGGVQPGKGPYAFHEYALRHLEKFGLTSICHFPEVLFHANADTAVPSPTLLSQTVQAHLDRCAIKAKATPGLLPESVRILYQHDHTPLVSILIPTKDQQPLLSRCLETIIEKTAYKNYEILVIDNQSTTEEAKQYLLGLEALNVKQLRVLRYRDDFNYAAMNNLAAREAKGEYLVLLNNDTAIIQDEWLGALLNHAQRPEVGAVGAKLITSDGHIQHAGIVLGLRGVCDHPFIGEDGSSPGYGGRLKLDQRYSAVSAACMMVRKSVYIQLGGLDQKDLDIAYSDADFCLRLRTTGLSVIWTPYALLVHEGGASFRAQSPEASQTRLNRVSQNREIMYQRWMAQLICDPAYNPNFRLSGRGFDLEASSLFYPPAPSQKKLLTHCADIWGSGLYRIISPTTALLEKKMITGECHADYLSPVEIHKAMPDSIVLQRQITERQRALIQNYKRYSRAKLIFELDDYLPNLPVASSAKMKFPRAVVKQMRRSMEMCDRIVVSTAPLKESLSQFHDEIIVLPNYLPVSLWGNIPPRKEAEARRPRVGWAGGSSHTGDLRVIADIVSALSDRVDWIFFGMKPEGVDEHIKEFHPGVHLGKYPENLASLDLDLALAPLEENIFNECKSNLRLLEYGICGYPIIATNIPPYQCGFPITLTSNRFKDWKQAIEDKISDLDALRKEGAILQDFVKQHWMLEGDNLIRWQNGWLLSPDSPAERT